MKICLINNLYGAFARGGAETVAAAYANGLKAAGHEVVIITLKPPGSTVMSTGDILYLAGSGARYFKLRELSMFSRFSWHLADIFNYPNYRRIKKFLSDNRVELVMSHNLMGVGFLTALAARSLKIKHYHFLHDIQLLHPAGLMCYGSEYKVDSLFAKIYQSITRSLMGSPDKIISPSRWLLAEHEQRGFFQKSEKLVIKNPVATTGAKKIVERVAREKFSFLFVGQLEDHKGIIFLVKAFLGLNLGSVELAIVGGGSLDEKLKNLTDNYNNLKLLGRKSRPEVAALMAAADCLIVPSLCYENSPTVISEAFSSGLPVLAARIGGIPELFAGQPENLFIPGDEADLKKGMLRMIEDRHLPAAPEPAAHHTIIECLRVLKVNRNK